MKFNSFKWILNHNKLLMLANILLHKSIVLIIAINVSGSWLAYAVGIGESGYLAAEEIAESLLGSLDGENDIVEPKGSTLPVFKRLHSSEGAKTPSESVNVTVVDNPMKLASIRSVPQRDNLLEQIGMAHVNTAEDWLNIFSKADYLARLLGVCLQDVSCFATHSDLKASGQDIGKTERKQDSSSQYTKILDIEDLTAKFSNLGK